MPRHLNPVISRSAIIREDERARSQKYRCNYDAMLIITDIITDIIRRGYMRFPHSKKKEVDWRCCLFVALMQSELAVRDPESGSG